MYKPTILLQVPLLVFFFIPYPPFVLGNFLSRCLTDMIVQARKTTMRQIFGTFLIFEFPNLFCTQGKELRRLVLTIYYSKVVGPKSSFVSGILSELSKAYSTTSWRLM